MPDRFAGPLPTTARLPCEGIECHASPSWEPGALLPCWSAWPRCGPIPRRRPRPPSSHNAVEPIFTRLGCNQGACHGKNAGQNGFRLSLRGYAPEMDHGWITREFQGRRVNPTTPAQSLLLAKPTGQVPHEGGVLMKAGGREYR